jgi:hypothetical protein
MQRIKQIGIFILFNIYKYFYKKPYNTKVLTKPYNTKVLTKPYNTKVLNNIIKNLS